MFFLLFLVTTFSFILFICTLNTFPRANFWEQTQKLFLSFTLSSLIFMPYRIITKIILRYYSPHKSILHLDPPSLSPWLLLLTTSCLTIIHLCVLQLRLGSSVLNADGMISTIIKNPSQLMFDIVLLQQRRSQKINQQVLSTLPVHHHFHSWPRGQDITTTTHLNLLTNLLVTMMIWIMWIHFISQQITKSQKSCP